MHAAFEQERAALQTALEAAAASERRSRSGPALSVGLRGALFGAMIGAAGQSLTALGAHLLALQEAALEWHIVAWCVGGCAIIGFLFTFMLHWRGDTSRAHLAQRLDAHNATGGSILAALELSRRAVCAFSAVAVQDGVAAARSAETPRAVRPVLQHMLALATISAVLLAVALLMPPRSISVTAKQEAATSDGTPPANVIRNIGAQALKPHQPDAPIPAPITGAGTGPGRKPEATAASAEAPRAQRPSSGQPGSGRSAEVAKASESSAAQGESIPGGAPPQENPEGRKDAPKVSAAAKPRVQKPKAGEEEKNGATAGQSGSGGGALSAVKSPWSQRDRGSADPLSENDTDERIEDDPDEAEARSGTQPSTKDRRGTTSKDLSISGPGTGGKGRGGPSLPKKARGTGSLVLGVPIPDFVRGLLNPGTTRITHERVQPSVLRAPEDAAVPTRTRQNAAVLTPQSFVPQRLRQLLSLYWIAQRKGA